MKQLDKRRKKMQVHEAISKRSLDKVDMYAALSPQTDRLFPIFEHKARQPYSCTKARPYQQCDEMIKRK